MNSVTNTMRHDAFSRGNSAQTGPIRAYLLLYNCLQCVLWLHTLYLIATEVPQFMPVLNKSSGGLKKSMASLYIGISPSALLAQKLSWLEVLHAATGLVGGGIVPAFVQALGRSAVLLILLENSTTARSSAAAITLVVTAAVGDVVRYQFYATSLLNICPRWLLKLRYSVFLVCYPVGIVSEWLLYFISLDEIDARGVGKIQMPNSLNFAFDYAVWNRVVLILYFYFGPSMYLYMLKQRRNKLHQRAIDFESVSSSENGHRPASVGS